MTGLGLTPNEIVGWRIRPDWYNFTVVAVKRFGPTSKRVGQEYVEALAYCRSLESAASWLIQHVTRVKAELLQNELEVAEGDIASAHCMLAAMQVAQAATLEAVAALDARMTAAGLTSPKKTTHFLGGTAPVELPT